MNDTKQDQISKVIFVFSYSTITSVSYLADIEKVEKTKNLLVSS